MALIQPISAIPKNFKPNFRVCLIPRKDMYSNPSKTFDGIVVLWLILAFLREKLKRNKGAPFFVNYEGNRINPFQQDII